MPTDKEVRIHWVTLHPPPNMGELLAIADPEDRLRQVLVGLDGWYRETEPMAVNIERDRLLLPALNEVLNKTGGSLATRCRRHPRIPPTTQAVVSEIRR